MAKKENAALVELFRLVREYLGKNPSEDKCHQALIYLLNGVNAIEEDVVVSNFQQHWLNIKDDIKNFADPATFRLHELQINQKINKILDPEMAR